MTLPISARKPSTKSNDVQYDVLTAALRSLACNCGGVDCMAYVTRGALHTERDHFPSAPSTTLLALAKRSLVVLDKSGARIVGAYVTDLGRREQYRRAVLQAHAERTARIVQGRP